LELLSPSGGVEAVLELSATVSAGAVVGWWRSCHRRVVLLQSTAVGAVAVAVGLVLELLSPSGGVGAVGDGKWWSFRRRSVLDLSGWGGAVCPVRSLPASISALITARCQSLPASISASISARFNLCPLQHVLLPLPDSVSASTSASLQVLNRDRIGRAAAARQQSRNNNNDNEQQRRQTTINPPFFIQQS
jgi:hypothetical protein